MKSKKSESRIKKEWNEFAQCIGPNPKIRASKFQGELYHWKVYMEGPQDTPYQGGTFQIDIQFPLEYPFQPPLVKFDTKIWHPNISSKTGKICIDNLQQDWAPSRICTNVLLSIQSLLDSPEFNDPKNLIAAQEYNSNKRSFYDHAKEFTQKYASAQVYQAKITELVERGFLKQKTREVLESTGYDLELAEKQLSVLKFQ